MMFQGKQVYKCTLWGEDDVTSKLDESYNRWVVDKEDEDGMILMKCIPLLNGLEAFMHTNPQHMEFAFEPYIIGKSAVDELEEFEDKYIFAAGADEEDIL